MDRCPSGDQIGERLPRQSRDYPVDKSLRQRVGPLAIGLWRDPDRVRRRSRTATKEPGCLRFAHARIKAFFNF